MPKKETPIQTFGYLRLGGELVDTRDLTSAQAQYVGTQIALTLLNTAHRGEAVFTADVPSVRNKGHLHNFIKKL